MKALEILIECLENEKDIMKGYENLSNIDYIQEAIAEVEALQEENEHLKRMIEAFKKENK